MLTIWNLKRLLACESIYWIGMNMDIETTYKLLYMFDFQQTKPNEKIIHHKIPGTPWEVVVVDMFTLHNKNYLCIVDYYRKVPVIKRWKAYQQIA